MDVNAPCGVVRFFADMQDPRSDQGKRHDLLETITIAICAVICGADGWEHVAMFGRTRQEWFRTFLELPHGIPSHDTFGRIFARLDPEEFERCFLNWIDHLTESTEGRLVAVDGKTLRRSFDGAAEKAAIHMVSAWCATNQTVLGQIVCEAKTNEITTIPKLLELLDLNGAVVTTDAMGCQKAIAGKIIEEGGDYLLQVKRNHEELYDALELLFAEGMRRDCLGVEHDYTEDVGKGHGRIETRRCWSTWEIEWFAERQQWKGLRSFVCIEGERQIGSQRSVQRRYFLSSLDGRDAQRMLELGRGHWGVENQLHWRLDVIFREDDRRIRKDHGAENFARLLRIGLNLLKKDKTRKASIKSKRLLAGWDHDYLLDLLTQEA